MCTVEKYPRVVGEPRSKGTDHEDYRAEFPVVQVQPGGDSGPEGGIVENVHQWVYLDEEEVDQGFQQVWFREQVWNKNFHSSLPLLNTDIRKRREGAVCPLTE